MPEIFDPARQALRNGHEMQHIQGHTRHVRRGGVENAFGYGVDYVLFDPEAGEMPSLLSRNRFNLWSLYDRDHGGPRGDGRGAAWFRDVLAERGLPAKGVEIRLLAQPRFLWFRFTPVSFWIAFRDGAPCAFVAEVNNTFGHRHCYFCAHDDFRSIALADTMTARKLMHVSPFQQVAGTYRFRFGILPGAIRIRIGYENGDDGVFATLTGNRRPATNASLLRAALRRPFGALRVLSLIHWQAIVLALKRAPFLSVPPPPAPLVSGGAVPDRSGT